MTWRQTQLGQSLCDQDNIILDLFANKEVNYIGKDVEFKKLLNHSDVASNLIIIINDQIWCSEIARLLNQHLKSTVETFYIGLNRYCVNGNDTVENFVHTGNHGNDIILMIAVMVSKLGYSITKSGCYDNDLGRHFNFVQPLTWAYGSKTNKSI